MSYIAALSLDEALSAISGAGPSKGPLTVVAGGTDVFPALGDKPFRGSLLDISRIAGLRGIGRGPEGWRIGAAARWSDLIAAPLPPCFDGLKAAAREVGSIQIQNAGTIAGNLCNASPAADGVPPLLSLDASVELTSARGVRRLALAEFLRGPRQTALAADELMTAILIPDHGDGARSGFLKLGARRYLVISICMTAALLEPDATGRVAKARVAVGACSAVAERLAPLEARLIGAPMTGGDLAALATPADMAALSPIDDIRADAAYRSAAALETVRRVLRLAAGEVDHG